MGQLGSECKMFLDAVAAQDVMASGFNLDRSHNFRSSDASDALQSLLEKLQSSTIPEHRHRL